METTENTKTAEMTARQEALAIRLGFDAFAELVDEITNHSPRPLDYYEEFTADEMDAYCWED